MPIPDRDAIYGDASHGMDWTVGPTSGGTPGPSSPSPTAGGGAAPGGNMVVELEARDKGVKQPKIIYAGDEYAGQPYLLVSEEDIAIVGAKGRVLSVSPDYGILLGGKVSISCLPSELAFGGGYWRLDPRHLSTLPSTTPTPLPLFVKSTPALLGGKKNIQASLDYMEGRSDATTRDAIYGDASHGMDWTAVPGRGTG